MHHHFSSSSSHHVEAWPLSSAMENKHTHEFSKVNRWVPFWYNLVDPLVDDDCTCTCISHSKVLRRLKHEDGTRYKWVEPGVAPLPFRAVASKSPLILLMVPWFVLESQRRETCLEIGHWEEIIDNICIRIRKVFHFQISNSDQIRSNSS